MSGAGRSATIVMGDRTGPSGLSVSRNARGGICGSCRRECSIRLLMLGLKSSAASSSSIVGIKLSLPEDEFLEGVPILASPNSELSWPKVRTESGVREPGGSEPRRRWAKRSGAWGVGSAEMARWKTDPMLWGGNKLEEPGLPDEWLVAGGNRGSCDPPLVLAGPFGDRWEPWGGAAVGRTGGRRLPARGSAGNVGASTVGAGRAVSQGI